MIDEVKKELRKYASSGAAEILQRFFKTGPGEYGEGDKFIGVKVPGIRKTASRYPQLLFRDLKILLNSPVHEERLLALIILSKQFAKADEKTKEEIVRFYLDNHGYVNNWDLVDLSAPYILGPYLLDKDKELLFDYTRNGDLWEKRIAVLSTFYFIKKDFFDTTFQLTEILLKDKRDLINKACGWMLREIGKRDLPALESFLKKYYNIMPRTMLRYAIEKFPEKRRLEYLKGKI